MNEPQVLVVEPPQPGRFAQSSAPPYSGSRRVCEAFLRALLRCGEIPRVLVLASRGDVEQWRTVLRRTDVSCECAAVTMDCLAQMNLGPDVVITPMNSDLTSGIYLRQALRQPSWPVVGMTHDLSHPTFFHAMVLAQLAGVRAGDAIVCCSGAAKSALERLSGHARRLAGLNKETLVFPVIPHGIDPATCLRHDKGGARARLSLAADARVFLYFGRIARASKADLDGLIRTFARHQLSATACLMIAGGVASRYDCIYMDELLRLSAELGILDKIRFLPNPDEAQKQLIYSGADVFVSPANSFQESFGLALLEAMAYALPVVASDWNGYREIVVQGETGYLAITRLADDMVHQLADLPFFYRTDLHEALSGNVRIDFDEFGAHMERLGSNEALCDRLGRAGLARLRRDFMLERVIRRYRRLWTELADRALHSPEPALGISPFIDYGEVFARHPSP